MPARERALLPCQDWSPEAPSWGICTADRQFSSGDEAMLRAIALSAVGILMAMIAYAAGDIPTRYAGSLPSVHNPTKGSRTNITGTLAEGMLTLKYTFRKGAISAPTTGRYSCAQTSSNKTKCTGQYRTADGKFSGADAVEITWSNGRPVAVVC